MCYFTMTKNTETELIYSDPNSISSDRRSNLIPFIDYHTPAPTRCLDMILSKYYGNKFQTEVIMTSPKKRVAPKLKCALSDATLMLFTDGGLVPLTNPDRIPSSSANKFGIYPIGKMDTLLPENYEVSHQGYDNSYVEEDPNRLIPLDALSDLTKKGMIKRIHPFFLSTTGVMMPKKQCEQIAKQIAQYAVSHSVDAVLITSACGTSTRSGACIGLEIENKGIPVVQIANLTHIALFTGLSRVVKGYNVCCPCGNPHLSPEDEILYRKQLVSDALHLLNK